MANDNKKIIRLGADQDDDPTAELELLPEAVRAEIEADREVEAESDDRKFNFAGLDTELGDADETIPRLKSGLELHAETIRALQFEIEQLRSNSTGFEKESKVLEEAMNNITEELKIAHKKQIQTSEILEKRDSEIVSLRSQLSDKEQTLIEFARQIEDAKNKEQESVSLESKEALINHFEQDIDELRKPEIPAGSRRETISDNTARANANDEPHELALLVPINGKASSEHPIKTGRLSLGSSPDNDIQVKSAFISRHHAQIISSSTDSILGDLNSTNGTYVNSKRIKRHALRNGDSITIGKNRFKYVKQNSGSPDQGKAAREEHT